MGRRIIAMSLGLALMRALFVLLVVLADILPNRRFLRPAQIRVPWIQKSQVSPALPEAGMAGLREGGGRRRHRGRKRQGADSFPKAAAASTRRRAGPGSALNSALNCALKGALNSALNVALNVALNGALKGALKDAQKCRAKGRAKRRTKRRAKGGAKKGGLKGARKGALNAGLNESLNLHTGSLYKFSSAVSASFSPVFFAPFNAPLGQRRGWL